MGNTQIKNIAAVMTVALLAVALLAGASASLAPIDAKPIKKSQPVKIIVTVDASGVDNMTDAAQAYKFYIQAGGQTSKVKKIDANSTEDKIKLTFNEKFNVVSGDEFTINADSNNANYQNAVAKGTIKDQSHGKSQKTSLGGTATVQLEQIS